MTRKKKDSVEQYQVRGRKEVYTDFIEAFRALKVAGPGSELVRVNDGVVMAFIAKSAYSRKAVIEQIEKEAVG